ncbi:MAG TPA: type I polyketide synthase, partial [Nannocystis sp.]
AAAVRDAHEPIAIVGASCRLPGDVDSPRAFWSLMDGRVDAITEVPGERWDIDEWYDADFHAPGKMNTRYGGFVTGMTLFDAEFFGITPREASVLDPQQRMFLELSWEALEHAGIAPSSLQGTETGVYVGLMSHDYTLLQWGDFTRFDGSIGIGNTGSAAAGRVSYTLGTHGPSMSIDTACSSSLVATHLACNALRNHECDVALAGGVSLNLHPAIFVEFSRLRGMAPDGRCKTFSAAADGVAWAEGCGVLVLKRLSDARRDGDRVLALLRGSAVNHDGRSNGLTAPSGPAQEAVVRRALRDAGVKPSDIDYVESHGTGTPIGDPIEARALGAVFRGPRASGRPLWLGAVKTNIGHPQAAAGVAGILKVALALRNRRIPANLHFEAPSPNIQWDEFSLAIPVAPVAWERGERPRIAGVSAFGISGINAHVVVQEAPEAADEDEPASESVHTHHLLPLAAKSPAALAALVARYLAHLEANPGQGLQDICHTAAVGRDHPAHRLAIVSEDLATLRETLLAVVDQQERANVVVSPELRKSGAAIVFVFPGQGSQWLGMGRELMREPAFAEAIAACDAAIAEEAGWSLRDELAADEAHSRLHAIEVVQPALFAMEYALAALWRAWGIHPSVVIGHSMGEVAAACVAGALSLRDAVAVICRRSDLLRAIAGQGGMVQVELPLAETEAAIAGRSDRISVAASNSPQQTVVAGDPDALAELVAELQARGVVARSVKVDIASHSPQVDPLRPALLRALAELSPTTAAIPMMSTVRAERVDGRTLDAAYWADNLRQPVRLHQGVAQLLAEGHTLFLEVSPHPILTAGLQQTLAG